MKHQLNTLKPIAWAAFWRLIGLAGLGLGLLGAVLPVLPTTPFVILAAFAFSKSSPRLQAYLEDQPVFGSAICDWRQHGAIATRSKAIAVGMMTVALVSSSLLSVPVLVLTVQAVSMGLAALFILSRPSRPRSSKSVATYQR